MKRAVEVSTALLPAGQCADDRKGFFARGHGRRQRRVGRFVRQVLLAGKEADERPPPAALLIAYRAAQGWVAGLERVEHRSLRGGALGSRP